MASTRLGRTSAAAGAGFCPRRASRLVLIGFCRRGLGLGRVLQHRHDEGALQPMPRAFYGCGGTGPRRGARPPLADPTLCGPLAAILVGRPRRRWAHSALSGGRETSRFPCYRRRHLLKNSARRGDSSFERLGAIFRAARRRQFGSRLHAAPFGRVADTVFWIVTGENLVTAANVPVRLEMEKAF